MTSRRTHLWYSHELCNFHDPGTAAGYLPVGPLLEPPRNYSADPDLRRAEGLVKATGVIEHYEQRTPQPATDQQLQTVHSPTLIHRVERLSAQGHGDAGAYAPVNYHSAVAARLAAGAAIEATGSVLTTPGTNAYCLTRPPGHHAEPDQAMALCLFNNIALAARAAQRQHDARVMILDWDVHHGNGTQATFVDDPTVLYISLHQNGLFPPGSGTVLDTGAAAGEGTTLNIPLPAGSGHGAYAAAIERIVEPAARHFRPDIILVSAGVDAAAHDPMGRMMLTSHSFHHMTARVAAIAEELCAGRVVLVHEGGYSGWYQPVCILSQASALARLPAPADPFLTSLTHLPGQAMEPHQERVIRHIEKHHPALNTTRDRSAAR